MASRNVKWTCPCGVVVYSATTMKGLLAVCLRCGGQFEEEAPSAAQARKRAREEKWNREEAERRARGLEKVAQFFPKGKRKGN